MESLPHPPHVYTWDCKHCRRPSDLWDWGRLDETSDDPLPVVCTECQVDLAPPAEQDAQRAIMHVTNRLLRLVRRLAELPGGTLIVCPEDIGKSTPRGITRFPGLIFAVELDSWDPSWPEDVLATWDPMFPDSVFRIIGELPFAGPDREGRNIPAGLVTVWSLAWPNDPPTTALFSLSPSTFSPTTDQLKRLNVAGRLLLNLRDPRGRRRGSGEYLGTAEDLEAAVVDVVCGLIKKRRDPTYRPKYGEIGREIDTKHRTTKSAKSDRWAKPEESFPRLCKRRGFNPRDLVDHAIAVCATRE